MVESGFDCKSFACMTAGGKFQPHTIKRRECGDDDVHIEIAYAGICHSDIHQAREEWGPANFPMVPGHEIAGKVVAVGKNVTKFKVGDHAGVGCFVDSCRNCNECKKGLEQYCKNGRVGTYNGREKYPHCPGYKEKPDECALTYGGYSQHIVVDQNYVCSIPESIPLEEAAPLLCAGITVYSPLKHYGVEKGMRVAVAGLGGLGAMAVKFAVAFGCHVTVISRGTAKKEEALSRLGAHDFVDSTDKTAMAAKSECFDRIIDTISADHDVMALMLTLDIDGICILVGIPPSRIQFIPQYIYRRRRQFVGSLIGGIKETQEMLDFCAENKISSDVEVIKPDYIDQAYDRTVKGDVRYRFCIDVKHM